MDGDFFGGFICGMIAMFAILALFGLGASDDVARRMSFCMTSMASSTDAVANCEKILDVEEKD